MCLWSFRTSWSMAALLMIAESVKDRKVERRRMKDCLKTRRMKGVTKKENRTKSRRLGLHAEVKDDDGGLKPGGSRAF